IARVVLACVLMGALLWFAAHRLDWIALRATPWLRVGWLLGIVAVAAALYFGVLWAMGLRPRQFTQRA
ncbi:MAG: lipid II flippase MurJ, partial [Betaproteobacteria bacterium]|nr:lipid II flippase MurJ [Betaproteobacteria bacterium]